MPKLSAQSRARKIKLLLFDVDGVLTDGKLFIFPAPAGTQQSVLEQSAKHGGQGGFGLHSQSLIEAKGFHAHDGTSISLARLAGIRTGLITKRISETVALRARDLKLEFVRQGIQDKRTAFEEIVKEAGLKLEEAAFVGDDVIDLPAMRAGGLVDRSKKRPRRSQKGSALHHPQRGRRRCPPRRSRVHPESPRQMERDRRSLHRRTQPHSSMRSGAEILLG